MKKLLQSPLLFALVGSLSGLGLNVGLVWSAAGAMVAKAKLAREKAEPAHPGGGWDFWTVEMDNLSNELKEEKERLQKQAQQLEQRAARLAAERDEMDKVRNGLEATRKEIGDRVVEITADEQKNLRTLSQTYTNLTPKAAVAIFRELDDITAVKILSLMKPEVVGPIFEEMTRSEGPDGPLARRAAALSEKLRLVKGAGNS